MGRLRHRDRRRLAGSQCEAGRGSPTRTLCSGQRWHRTGQDRWSRGRRNCGCRYRPSSAPRPGWSPGYCRSSRTPWGTEYPRGRPFSSTSVRRTHALTGDAPWNTIAALSRLTPGGTKKCDGFVVVGDPLPVGDMTASCVRQLDDRCLDRLVVRERPGGYVDVLRGPGFVCNRFGELLGSARSRRPR